jgi:hypothetical protein
MRLPRFLIAILAAASVALAPVAGALAAADGSKAAVGQAVTKSAMADCHKPAPKNAPHGKCPGCGTDGKCPADCLVKCFQSPAVIGSVDLPGTPMTDEGEIALVAPPGGWSSRPPPPPPRA